MPRDGEESRHEVAIALFVLLCAVCLLHREVLFGGHVYHMDDAADGYYPGHIAVARAFAHGQLPTWERGSWCGWPLVVDPYNGVFYPLNVVYYLAGAARGLGLAVALHVFLGGVGMWRLLRRRGLALDAALFGALAYELSSFGVVRIRHVIFVQMMGWLPWILVGVERWFVHRRARDLAFVAGATGLALVAGALSIGHFAALVIAAYTVARAVPEDGDLRRMAKDLLALGGAALAGLLLAACQVVPTVAHLPYSPRALASDYKFASSYAWPNLVYLATLLQPDFFGGEDRALYAGSPNHWELAGWYAGALCALFAPAALLALLRRNNDALHRSNVARDRVVLPVLLGAVLLAVGLALGDVAPVHRFFYKHVPLYAALRCPARAMLMAVLALPILGAHGLSEALDRLSSSAPPVTRATIGRALITLAAGALAVAAAMLGLRALGRHYLPVASAATTWIPALRALAPVLGGGVAALAAACVLPRALAGAPFVLILAFDLLSVDRAYVALYHRPADYPAGMERFAAVEWLLKKDPPRAPDLDGGGDRFVNDPRGPFRLHNVGMVLGLENASGYDSVAVWRYVDFLHILKTGRRYPHRELRDDFAAIGVWNLSSPLLDLMNVRWLLAGDPPDPRWELRFRPTPPTGSPAAKYEPWWDPRMNVFENTRALPRAFIAHRAEVPGSDDQLAARLAAPGFDPGAVALLEESPGLALPSENLPATPARIVEAGRHRLSIETDDPRPGILIVSDVHYPGWTVTVDGAPARLLRADYAFRGVPLPAGRHRVEMRFRSRPTEIGLALSAVGLALVAGLALARRRA